MDASPERKMPPEDGGRDYRNTTKGHTHTHEAERDASVDQVPPYSLHEGPATDNCDFSVSLPDSELDDGIC